MITLYTKSNCMQCQMTKMWLTQNGHPYEEINIEEKPEAIDELKSHGYSAMPVVSIDNELANPEKTWAQFQIDRLEKL